MSDKNNKLSSTVKGMNDEDIVEQHTKLGREKHAPTEGFLIAPLVFVFVFGCLIFVCSVQLAHSTNSFNVDPPKEVVVKTEEEIEEERFATKLALGKKGFEMRCASCHQKNGLGLDLFPPLAGSEWVTANPELITKIILKGLKGEITVKGKKYGTLASVAMLAVDIDDAEIANISTYVRNAWGNSATEVFEKDVADVRINTLEQEGQWIGQELQLEYLSDLGSD